MTKLTLKVKEPYKPAVDFTKMVDEEFREEISWTNDHIADQWKNGGVLQPTADFPVMWWPDDGAGEPLEDPGTIDFSFYVGGWDNPCVWRTTLTAMVDFLLGEDEFGDGRGGTPPMLALAEQMREQAARIEAAVAKNNERNDHDHD